MPYVMDLQELNENHAVVVGGKAANLGRLAAIDGVSVPAGFCLTTEAFDRFMHNGGPERDHGFLPSSDHKNSPGA